MITYLIILLLSSTGVLAADQPDWYPENASEIEVECQRQHPISAEAKADIQNFKLTDVPNMSSLLLCIASGQNVYQADVELEPERMAYGLYRSVNLNCDLDLVRDCLDRHKGEGEKSNHEEFMYLSIQCIFESVPERCVSSE